MHTSFFFFFSSRRRHTRLTCDWSSDVCSSDLVVLSSLHDAETAVHARAAGAGAYLFKGCSTDEVVAAVLEVAAPAAAPTELSRARSRPLPPRPLRAAARGA